jgi:hypothetical protein
LCSSLLARPFNCHPVFFFFFLLSNWLASHPLFLLRSPSPLAPCVLSLSSLLFRHIAPLPRLFLAPSLPSCPLVSRLSLLLSRPLILIEISFSFSACASRPRPLVSLYHPMFSLAVLALSPFCLALSPSLPPRRAFLFLLASRPPPGWSFFSPSRPLTHLTLYHPHSHLSRSPFHFLVLIVMSLLPCVLFVFTLHRFQPAGAEEAKSNACFARYRESIIYARGRCPLYLGEKESEAHDP